MYTIGTAAIQHIANNATDSNIQQALANKLVAYVGLAADRTASQNPVSIGEYTCFFEVIDYSPSTPASLYTTINDGTGWEWSLVGTIANTELLTDLRAASGFHNVLYAMQRGNKADMQSPGVHRVDGIPFFARDTRELYIYDKNVGDFVLLTTLNNIPVPVGVMVTWPEAVTPPVGWLRCNGLQVSRTVYNDLYNIIHDNYGPTDGVQFTLPLSSSSIIRALP